MAAPVEIRFWRKVDQQGDCWIWTAAKQPSGYGRFGVAQGQIVLVHRWAYEQMVGPIADGLVIDHLCRNRACVNPAHMEPVPQAVNVRRGDVARIQSERRRSQTHCARGGHELSGDNLRVDKRGRRCCKECHRNGDRERKRRYRELRKVA